MLVRFFIILLMIQSVSVEAKNQSQIEILRQKIFNTAKKYQGKADPDFKIQNEIKGYVDKLISLSSNRPLDKRKDSLVGRWQQIWGAYDYSDDERGVDPQIDSKAIYQMIFEDGYYYNITRLLDKKTKKEKYITLLKGLYEILPGNLIKFELRKLTKVETLGENLTYFDLPEQSQKNMLVGESKIIPNWMVRTFFNGGFLIEVYLDKALRVFYFFDDDNFKKPYLYVMKKVL